MRPLSILLSTVLVLSFSYTPPLNAGPVNYSTIEGACINPVDEHGQFPTCGYPYCRPYREDGLYTITQGDVNFEYLYANGKIDGLFRSYRIDETRNGEDKRVFLTKYRYKQGVMDGTQKVYDPDKKFLLRQCEHKLGKLQSSIEYFENESMKKRIGYANEGKKPPKITRYQKYAKNGSVIEEMKDNLFKYYDPKGTVTLEETLKEREERVAVEEYKKQNLMLNATAPTEPEEEN